MNTDPLFQTPICTSGCMARRPPCKPSRACLNPSRERNRAVSPRACNEGGNNATAAFDDRNEAPQILAWETREVSGGVAGSGLTAL
jgi:hypothetical protein